MLAKNYLVTKGRDRDMKKMYRLQGLGCAACAAKMENAIAKLDGVNEVSVNFITTKLSIDGDEEKMPGIVEAAEKIVRKIEPDTRMRRA